jgi:uncharacterized repeat protein (TIGR03806 family)
MVKNQASNSLNNKILQQISFWFTPKGYFFFNTHSMRQKIKLLLTYFILALLFVRCSSDNDPSPTDDGEATEVSPVNYNLDAMPYPKLSDYNIYKSPMKDMDPVYGVIPFKPASQLFTDYATKSRFIWMPEGAKANFVSEDKIFDFPTGTILIKNFYYENVLPSNTKKNLETRLIIKKGTEWVFATYVWNEEQTEAYFDLEGSFIPIEFAHNGTTKNVNYRIPSASECLSCHKTNDVAIPIGPKPVNINFNLDYANGNQNQIDKWEEFGYLNMGTPANIAAMVDFNDASKPLNDRFRSYADINCAHCHNPTGNANYLPINLSFTATVDPTQLGVCVIPNVDISGMIGVTVTHIIKPGDPVSSSMYQRIKSEQENVRMPLLGRSLVHDEAIVLTEQWINSLSGDCN